MGVIEDVRKVVQDLVTPELKSLAVMLESMEPESRLRDENLAAKIDRIESESRLRDESLAKELRARDELLLAKLEALSAKADAQHTSVIYSLNLDKRVGMLERDKQSASA